MSKELTIDDLARMTADGFAESAEKIDHLQSQMDRGFANVSATFTRIENRLNAMNDRTLADHERRLASLEAERRGL